MLTSEFQSNDEFHPKHQDESDDPFYSEENLARLKESMAQLKRGQVVEKTLDELRVLVYGQTAIH